MREESHFATSRVCTPAPEAVDPVLSALPSVAPTVPQTDSAGMQPLSRNDTLVQRAVMIKMGVEELRTLIAEVVQRVIDGAQTVKSEPKSDESNTDAAIVDETVVGNAVNESVVNTTEDSGVSENF
jgi:hypothetical protein